MTSKIPLERKEFILAYMLFSSSLREASAGAQDGKMEAMEDCGSLV